MSLAKLNLNHEIIALFDGQGDILTTPKLYLELTGCHSMASVLNQCVYWSNKSRYRDGSFYKTYKEWFQEIFIPERTLRRKFDLLESMGWITTKVKKVGGLNIKHIHPNIDRIIESLQIMVDNRTPIRPMQPDGADIKPNTCTEIIPYGHSSHNESANAAQSYTIYTEDYDQNKLTNCKDSSSSFFFSETLDQKILSAKLHSDERSDEEFMDNVRDHVDNHSDKAFARVVRVQGALKLLRKLKEQNIFFYSKGRQPKEEAKSKSNNAPAKNVPFTEEELALVSAYKYAKRMEKAGAPMSLHMPNEENQRTAQELIERINALEGKTSCRQKTPETNARKNCLKSVSSLVSHLRL